MTTAFMIPFNDILEKAFELREAQPELTIDELLKEILPNINFKITSDVPINIRKKIIKNDEDETPRKRKELTGDERCMARTVYEKIHLDEHNLLKVMRDEPNNLYGDRCKFPKKEKGHFCTRHSGYQSLGVWNGEYSGKLLDYVDKTKIGIVCQIVDDEPPKPVSKPKKAKAEDKPKKEKMVRPADNFKEVIEPSDEDTVDAFPINIDGIEYNIDESNNVWSDDGDLIGVYDRKKKIWLAKSDNT
jgi:hypothetical protein